MKHDSWPLGRSEAIPVRVSDFFRHKKCFKSHSKAPADSEIKKLEVKQHPVLGTIVPGMKLWLLMIFCWFSVASVTSARLDRSCCSFLWRSVEFGGLWHSDEAQIGSWRVTLATWCWLTATQKFTHGGIFMQCKGGKREKDFKFTVDLLYTKL